MTDPRTGRARRLRLGYNAPVVLTFVLLCVAVQLINMLTGNAGNSHVFSVGRPVLSGNPLTWFRLFLHVIGHSGWDHLLNNMMFILILGPMIEEKYGSLYLGQQIYNATQNNNVAELAHIAGGVVGGSLGFVMKKNKMDRYHNSNVR